MPSYTIYLLYRLIIFVFKTKTSRHFGTENNVHLLTLVVYEQLKCMRLSLVLIDFSTISMSEKNVKTKTTFI